MSIQTLLNKDPDATEAGKHIAVFCHNFEINGANNFIYTLLMGLKTQHSFTIFSPKQGLFAERLRNENFNTEIVSISNDNTIELIKYYDLVIANTLMMAPVILDSVNTGTPHLLIVHETWKPKDIDFYIHELWQIDGLTTSDVISCLEEAHKIVFPAHYLANVYREIVEPHRQQTIYCTIDFESIDRFRADNTREDARLLLGLENDILLFLQVGTITPRKAQLNTVKAFYSFIEKKPESKAKLFLVGARSFRPGEREYIQEIQNYISQKNLFDRVTIFEVRSDIYMFFMAADILVHPSVNEVLPLAILEAAAFGLAIIASDLDGIPEAFRHKKEAILINPFILFDLEIACISLGTDINLRKKLGVSASKKVRKQHSGKKFSEMYNQLIIDA